MLTGLLAGITGCRLRAGPDGTTGFCGGECCDGATGHCFEDELTRKTACCAPRRVPLQATTGGLCSYQAAGLGSLRVSVRVRFRAGIAGGTVGLGSGSGLSLRKALIRYGACPVRLRSVQPMVTCA